VRSFLENPEEQFQQGPITVGTKGNAYDHTNAFTCKDPENNYISARWPGDAYLFGMQFIEMIFDEKSVPVYTAASFEKPHSHQSRDTSVQISNISKEEIQNVDNKKNSVDNNANDSLREIEINAEETDDFVNNTSISESKQEQIQEKPNNKAEKMIDINEHIPEIEQQISEIKEQKMQEIQNNKTEEILEIKEQEIQEQPNKTEEILEIKEQEMQPNNKTEEIPDETKEQVEIKEQISEIKKRGIR